MILLVFVCLAGLSWSLLGGLNELRGETRGLITLIEALQHQQSELAATVKKLSAIAPAEPTVKVPVPVPNPSRNPSKDVTGASARATKRIADQSQCDRVCRTLIQCLSTSEICPGLGTDGTREALQHCTEVCGQDKSSRLKLMDMTDCPARLKPDVPPSLRDICIDSK